MAVESASFINQLVVTNPVGGDQRSTADDHLRLIKVALKQSFPNVGSEMSASSSNLNQLVGVTYNINDKFNDISAGYRSSIAATSAALDTKVESLSATLNTKIDGEISARAVTSAALDTKIESLSATLNTRITNTSAALDTKIEALSAALATDISEVRFYTALATLGATQSATDNASTELRVHTIVSDPLGVFSTSTSAIVFPAGYSMIKLTANVILSAPNFPYATRLASLKGGSVYSGGFDQGGSWIISNSNQYNINASSAFVSAVAGDQFKVIFNQNNTAAVDAKMDGTSWISVDLIKEGGGG